MFGGFLLSARLLSGACSAEVKGVEGFVKRVVPLFLICNELQPRNLRTLRKQSAGTQPRVDVDLRFRGTAGGKAKILVPVPVYAWGRCGYTARKVSPIGAFTTS